MERQRGLPPLGMVKPGGGRHGAVWSAGSSGRAAVARDPVWPECTRRLLLLAHPEHAHVRVHVGPMRARVHRPWQQAVNGRTTEGGAHGELGTAPSDRYAPRLACYCPALHVLPV